MHSFIHSFIQQVFIEYVLCAGHCARHWGTEKATPKSLMVLTSLMLLIFIQTGNMQINSEMKVTGTTTKINRMMGQK